MLIKNFYKYLVVMLLGLLSINTSVGSTPNKNDKLTQAYTYAKSNGLGNYYNELTNTTLASYVACDGSADYSYGKVYIFNRTGDRPHVFYINRDLKMIEWYGNKDSKCLIVHLADETPETFQQRIQPPKSE